MGINVMSQVIVESPYAQQIAELKGFASKQRDGRQLKKALAVKLLYQGYKHEAVVQILDVSMGSLTNWKSLYEA